LKINDPVEPGQTNVAYSQSGGFGRRWATNVRE
jgi:hypothetical protein